MKRVIAFYVLAAPGLLASSSLLAAVPTQTDLHLEIAKHKAPGFESLIQDWSTRYGAAAAAPLAGLASMKAMGSLPIPDSERYIAAIGAAKLGGKSVSKKLALLLKDPSWMVRNGALRGLTLINDPSQSAAVLPLLKDPALVVRVQAVEATQKLKPTGAVDALLATLSAKENFRDGKAQWVPLRALEALSALKPAGIAPKLRPLLFQEKDAELLEKTVATLETLTGQKLAADKPLAARALAWKASLAVTFQKK